MVRLKWPGRTKWAFPVCCSERIIAVSLGPEVRRSQEGSGENTYQRWRDFKEVVGKDDLVLNKSQQFYIKVSIQYGIVVSCSCSGDTLRTPSSQKPLYKQLECEANNFIS